VRLCSLAVEGPDKAILRAYEEAKLPGPATPWRAATFTVIDLETTGLDPAADEIIAFATVTVSGGRVVLDDATHQLVRPERMPEAESIRIHGLREGDLATAPALADALDGLLEALAGRVLVAHAAAVEEGFLGAALARHGIVLREHAIDTSALAIELRRRSRRRLRAVNGAGLSDLARSLGLPVHRPHEADGDALTTAQVFIALASHLDALEPQTVGSLLALPRRVSAWRRLFSARG
jgi:DNA polymerase-3 subunit epsilon